MKRVVPSQVSVEVLWRLDIDLRAEGFPEAIVLVVRTREQEIIHVHDQEESRLAKEEARRMRRDGYSAQLDDDLFKMSFPVSSGFRVAVESLLQKEASPL